MTFQQAIDQKQERDEKRLSEQQQDEQDCNDVEQVFNLLGIQREVCNRIDCHNCVAYYCFSDLGQDFVSCRVKKGTGKQRLAAMHVLLRWMEGKDAEKV